MFEPDVTVALPLDALEGSTYYLKVKGSEHYLYVSLKVVLTTFR